MLPAKLPFITDLSPSFTPYLFLFCPVTCDGYTWGMVPLHHFFSTYFSLCHQARIGVTVTPSSATAATSPTPATPTPSVCSAQSSARACACTSASARTVTPATVSSASTRTATSAATTWRYGRSGMRVWRIFLRERFKGLTLVLRFQSSRQVNVETMRIKMKHERSSIIAIYLNKEV